MDLEDIIYSIILWGEKHLKKCYKEMVHSSCNHKIELHYYCPIVKTIDKKELLVKDPE